jgi:hypothetical protein
VAPPPEPPEEEALEALENAVFHPLHERTEESQQRVEAKLRALSPGARAELAFHLASDPALAASLLPALERSGEGLESLPLSPDPRFSPTLIGALGA